MYIFQKNALLTQNVHNFYDLQTFVAKLCRCDLHTFSEKFFGLKIKLKILSPQSFSLFGCMSVSNQVRILAVTFRQGFSKKDKMGWRVQLGPSGDAFASKGVIAPFSHSFNHLVLCSRPPSVSFLIQEISETSMLGYLCWSVLGS